MRWFEPIPFLALFLGCVAPPPADPPTGEHGEEVLPPLVAPAVPPPAPSWTDEVDYTLLREAYGQRADYSERCESDQRRDASSALLAEKFERVLALTAPLLVACPVDASAHLWRGAALSSLGHGEEAEVHRRWYLGLIQSILDTGTGASAESPYVTISVAEEYQVLAHLGLNPIQQFSISDPTMLDAITTKDASGNESTVYFNPSLHYIRLFHQLQ